VKGPLLFDPEDDSDMCNGRAVCELRGIATQETELFIVLAIRTSNPAQYR
jgi:hypothetical protein